MSRLGLNTGLCSNDEDDMNIQGKFISKYILFILFMIVTINTPEILPL